MFDQTLREDRKDENGTGTVDVPYRIWVLLSLASAFWMVWSKHWTGWGRDHYEFLVKLTWTVIAPGFTLCRTWNLQRDNESKVLFAVLLILHFVLMELLFPYLPVERYGYILAIAIGEIMTLGLAYQVWMRLRPKPDVNTDR